MIVFEIVTNTDCNLRCDYCFAKDKNKSVMNEETIYNTVQFIKSMVNPKEEFIFKIYGGESLLYYENVIKLVELAEKQFNGYKFRIPIITNGTIFSSEICELVNNYSNITLSISVDGCEKIQDLHRKFHNGNSSWNLVKENILKYKKSIVNRKNHLYKLTLQYVMTQEVLENFDIVNEQLKSFELPYSELFMTDNGCNSINTKMFYSSIKYQFEKNINGNEYRLKSIPKSYKYNSKTREYCGAGKSYFCIVPNGDIYPCSLAYHNKLYKYKMGNVKLGIVLNENNLLLRSRVASQKCNKCDNNDLCLGYCIFNNLLERGDFNNLNDNLCKLNKIYTMLYKEKYYEK